MIHLLNKTSLHFRAALLVLILTSYLGFWAIVFDLIIPPAPPRTKTSRRIEMKIYLVTEAEKTALLQALELERFKTPDQFCITPEAKKAQPEAVGDMHRRFHYLVCKALE